MKLLDFINLVSDGQRRDLTMNAIAYEVATDTYIDPFNGRSDIQNGIIRAVSKHFAEDPLRVLRVARFAARYNFNIESRTLDMMRELVNAGELTHLSSERIYTELFKTMGELYPQKFVNVLKSVGALKDAFGVEDDDILTMTVNALYLPKFNSIDERMMFLFHSVSDNTFINFTSKFNLPSDMKHIMKLIRQNKDIAQLQYTKDADGIFKVFKQMDIMRRPFIFTQVLSQLCMSDAINSCLYADLLTLMYNCKNAVSNVDVLSYNLSGLEIKALLDGVLMKTIETHFRK